MVMSRLGPEFLDRLPLGIAAPLREAARTCQLAPPGDWPLTAYRAIGRNDLAASASDAPDLLYSDGYKPVKDFIVSHSVSSLSRMVLDDFLYIESDETSPDDISNCQSS